MGRSIFSKLSKSQLIGIFSEKMEDADRRTREAAEKSLLALQCEFLDFKTKVATELDRAAAEQVALQARLVETSVALAEARARIDDLTTHQRLPLAVAAPEAGILAGIFSNGPCEECEILRESEQRWRHRAEVLHRENSEIAQEFDRKFAAWRETVLSRVSAERNEMRARIAGDDLRSPNDDEEESVPENDDLDFVFDGVDWTGNQFDSPAEIQNEELNGKSELPS